MKKKILFLLSFSFVFLIHAQDWNTIDVPANPGVGMTWELDSSHSDSFNYNGKGSEFNQNWEDNYINGWDGPGLSKFSSNHSEVNNGNLIIKAARVPGTNKVFCGVISSPEALMYPVYMEISMKVSGLVLSSNFWFLSGDDRNELDVIETYGSERSDWFAKRQSTNYHIFERNSSNQIIKDHSDQDHHTLPSNQPLRNGFHRYGMYWKSPTDVEFYRDGEKIRTITQSGLTDPEGLYLDRPMRLIIDTEDHQWRSNQGIVASDAELANNSINKMFVDWVRVYKPIDINLSTVNFSIKNLKVYPNPVNNGIVNISGTEAQLPVSIFDITGRKIFESLSTNNNTQINVENLVSGVYLVVVDGYKPERILVRK